MLLSFSRASRFALAEWEGQRPSAVNMIEIEVELEIDSIAKKLPTLMVGEFPHQSSFKREIVGRREVSSRSGFRSGNGYITTRAMTTLPGPFVCLGFGALRGRGDIPHHGLWAPARTLPHGRVFQQLQFSGPPLSTTGIRACI